MQPTNPILARTLVTMLGSGDAVIRAQAENMVFEERVGAGRQDPYETGYVPAEPTLRAFLESHGAYVKAAVYTEMPETFLAANAPAALSAVVSHDAALAQVLVRVECLDFALTHTKVADLESLDRLRAVYADEIRDDHVQRGEAKALLDEVCASLNSNPYAVRPRFAAFAQDLEDDIEAGDWAERLRDRLGLPHYPSTKRFGPHPVALMRYTVGEVLAQARKLGAVHPLTVPTVLDAEPYEVFHPSPRDETYGRTLNLAGDPGCERLASEVLHLRIDYEPSHIWKVGCITRKADLPPERLTALREGHRECLQLLSGRFDFGKLGA